jgi:hypothetical protein
MAEPHSSKWFKNYEAAETLAVSVRTIKGWMRYVTKRKALGAVRNGKQWRIPRPDNIHFWEAETRQRFAALGVQLKSSQDSELEKLGQQNDKYKLESDRVFLALCLKASTQGAVTSQTREAILYLWQAAFSALHGAFANGRGRPSREQQEQCLDIFKAKLSPELLSHWPDDEIFKKVRQARTLKALEKIREGLDYALGVRDVEQTGQKPTAENLRPLLHKDIMQQINDSGEELQLKFIDMREPQNGLPLRTFRKRYPKKQDRQRQIVNEAYGIRETLPGAEESPDTGKTPVRGSSHGSSC